VFGSLDDVRRHNVVELLRHLHDRFEQVIVITHIESVREGLDRVLTVRYDEEARVARVASDAATAGDIEGPMAADEYAAAGAAG
jgi:exonuclease SbcC